MAGTGNVARVTVDSSAILIEGPWRHHFVAANGARFHVAEAGSGTSDAPLVVLLHGFPQFWWAWRHQLVDLAAAGYRVAAMDLRGHGASDKPPTGYDVPTLARDVAGVIRSLGASQAVVVGHGLGGHVAWSMPGLQPAVTRAVGTLSAPHPLSIHGDPWRSMTLSARLRLLCFQLPTVPERRLMHHRLATRLLRSWGAPGWLDDETAATYELGMRLPFAAHSAMESYRWLVRSTPRVDGQRYLSALRAPIGVPTLQLHGAADRCLPTPAASGDVIAPGVPYRFAVLPGVGHYLPEEAPEAVTELLTTWLAAVTGPGRPQG